MAKVFLSYVREDEEKVKLLAQNLTSAGVHVWLDREDIDPGYPWKDAIRRAISNGDFFIACFSHAYHNRVSTYMNEELTLAIEEIRKRPTDKAWFIPILLENCNIPDMTIHSGMTLNDIQYVPLYEDWDKGIKCILRVLIPNPVFDKAVMRLREIAARKPRTAELLLAATLKVLYLCREKLNPTSDEKEIIFNNLLLQGRGKHFTKRSKGSETETALFTPAPLGWFWLKEASKQEMLELTRFASKHPNIDVRTGTMRVLRRLGNKTDLNTVRQRITDNPKVAGIAVKALLHLGTDNDVEFMRSLISDKRATVRGAATYILAHRGTVEDENAIFALLADSDLMVRRDAVIAIRIRYFKTPSRQERYLTELKAVLNNPTELPQVRSIALEVVNLIQGAPLEFSDRHEKRVAKQATKLNLTNGYSEAKLNVAINTLSWNPSEAQEAGIRWLAGHAPEKSRELINDVGEQLHFHVLQRLDYHLYCPDWWQAAIELPDDQE